MAALCVGPLSVLDLFLWGHVSRYVPGHVLVRTVGWSVCVSAAVLAVSVAVFRRNRSIAIVMASIACMATLLQIDRFLGLGAAFGILAIVATAIRRNDGDLVVELAGCAFLSVLLVFAGRVALTIHDSSPVANLTLSTDLDAPLWPRTSAPDIYYIIVDGYGRPDVLARLFDADVSGFVGELEARGFYLPPQSRSNYIRTIQSLSSSLNMGYLDPWSATMGRSPTEWPMESALQENHVMKVLRKSGYRIVSTSQVWDASDIRIADHRIRPYLVNFGEFDRIWLASTALVGLTNAMSDYLPGFNYDTKRNVARATFEAIPRIATMKSPKLVFLHVMLPHPPFVFSSDGKAVDPPYPVSSGDGERFPGGRAAYVAGYRAQVAFLNSKLLEAVDSILAESVSPPVIIIQGDHGPGSRLDFESISDTCLWERFSIFSAYRLPGSAPEDIPADISPVNTFRMVFRRYFRTSVPLLSNRQYFSTTETPYEFTDVTGRVAADCSNP
jgi:hypothetical protein